MGQGETEMGREQRTREREREREGGRYIYRRES